MMFLWFLITIIFSIFNLSESIDCGLTPNNAEARLRQRLLCNYHKEVRPSEGGNATIVRIKLIVKSFQYSDDDRTLTINSWLPLKWSDKRLTWEKKDFDNMDSIVIKGDDLWIPDVTIYNSKSTQFEETCSIGNCVVYNTGWVTCIPPCTHEGNCKPDYVHWPFDTQNCTMHFGTWVNKGEEVNFEVLKTLIEGTTSHHKEWKMVQVTVKKLRGNYSCCPDETYPSIQYSFAIQRHSAAEQTFIMGPAIIFASVNLMALLLDPKCSERITLLLLSLIAHLLVIQQLSWHVPRNGDTVPTILLYARDSLMIAALILLHTIIMRALMACTAQTPQWVKKTTQTIKNNKIGDAILSKDYLLDRTPLHNESGEDAENIIEKETTIETVAKKEENTIWCTIVKVLDRLYFILLVLVYIILMFGWVPASYEKFTDTMHDRMDYRMLQPYALIKHLKTTSNILMFGWVPASYEKITVFASVNLMALLLDPNRSERVALLLFSLIAHFSVMRQLSWYIPRNGDSVPTMLIYVRDSLMITALLLLHTIIMRALIACTVPTPGWIKKGTHTIRSYKAVEAVLSKEYLLGGTSPAGEARDDTEREITVKALANKEENTIWCTIVKVLDRLYFALLVLVYTILMFGWVPSSYVKFSGKTNFFIIPSND